MQVLSILILGAASAFPPELAGAVAGAFPLAVSTLIPDLATAMAHPACTGLELLLIAPEERAGGTSPEDLLDAENLPRWAVLHFGGEPGSIPQDGWMKDQLIALLQQSVARHALNRDNARLRGELLTMARRVSHDLRTPLGGIIATVDMLAETIPSASDATKPVFSSIEEITKIITRTSFLLKAIAQPLPRKTLNMGTAAHEAILRLERPIYQKQATIHQPVAWPTVEGVAPWLELIWWNLIHNALKHTGSTQIITLGWEKESDGHRFWIRDAGPGLPAQPSREVFWPFHLLHDPNATHGLGLPIVRRLTQLQGGRCGHTPEPGGGSLFYFTLPDPQGA